MMFICSQCGESLKKNKVDQHCSTRCRKAQSVSCLDCSKEFWGDDYRTHTSCITESQKYSAPGTAFAQNKGDVKQGNWITAVKAYLADHPPPARLKALFDRVLAYDNIPRKQAKFTNFMKSAFHVSDPKVAAELWKVIEQATALMKQQQSDNTAPHKNDTVIVNCSSSSTGDSSNNRDSATPSEPTPSTGEMGVQTDEIPMSTKSTQTAERRKRKRKRLVSDSAPSDSLPGKATKLEL